MKKKFFDKLTKTKDWKNYLKDDGLVLGWDSCKKEVLEIFQHPKIDLTNLDIKFIKEEIEKL